MNDIFVETLANALWIVTGIILTKLTYIVQQIIPIRRLWRISNLEKISIITATSASTDTGEYERPATGIGQVRALSSLLGSLSKGYGRLDPQNIFLSEDIIGDRLEYDLIILGGEKTNAVAKKLLEKIESHQPVTQSGSTLHWRTKRNGHWEMDPESEFHGEVKNNKVVTDCGVIIRVQNPFITSKKRTALLIAGSHTYGTIAAAKYFAESMSKKLPKKDLKSKNLCVLISCDVEGDHPVAIKMEKNFTWD